MDKIIGDKRTHGTKNIPMFWNSKRYFSENVYHCVASSCLWAMLPLAIVFVVLANVQDWGTYNQTNSTTQIGLAIPVFIFLLTFSVCKINERKIRKQRENDIASSISRTIES
ncbi:MAG: hypothetical protein LBQ45_01400 [Mycoplasmataceae bacterium]|nr:hypothetical protein [Mycoplasmataceae bacterium]